MDKTSVSWHEEAQPVPSGDAPSTDPQWYRSRGHEAWLCPQCNQPNEGPTDGFSWHDCQHCGWSERQPTDLRSAKYQVVAMGELQQPGAVGATQTTGLVEADGVPNNPGDSMTDAGKNSFEQNVALETWVNLAVDMLNRGEEQDQVLAKLAHDGCPDPKGVIQMALQQPDKQQLPEEGTEDPFENQGGDPYEQTMPSSESVHHQPPVMAALEDPRRISLANDLFDPAPTKHPDQDIFDVDEPEKTDMDILFQVEAPAQKGEDADYQDPEGENGEVDPNSWKSTTPPKSARAHVITPKGAGVVLDSWSDLWGQNWTKVALENGQVQRFDPSQVQLDDTRRSPVEDIQAFIDSIPPVEPTRPSIFARLDNLNGVRRMIQSCVSKCSFEEQIKLADWDKTAAAETLELREVLSTYASEIDREYAQQQPKFAVPVGTVMDPAFNARITEKAAIWVSELPEAVKSDEQQFNYAAVRYAQSHNGDVPTFLHYARKYAKYRNEGEE